MPSSRTSTADMGVMLKHLTHFTFIRDALVPNHIYSIRFQFVWLAVYSLLS